MFKLPDVTDKPLCDLAPAHFLGLFAEFHTLITSILFPERATSLTAGLL